MTRTPLSPRRGRQSMGSGGASLISCHKLHHPVVEQQWGSGATTLSKWPKPNTNREAQANEVRLSPLARLYVTLDHEFKLDTSLITDDDRYKRFLEMFRLSEQKRDNILRSVLILDAIASVLTFGKSISIPVIGLSLSEIPAAREIVVFFSSFAFQFTATFFLNWNGYSAIIDTINLQRSRQTGVDPDWLSSSDKFVEFAVKLYRPKMNVYNPDIVAPERAYRIVSALISGLIVTTMLSLLFLHLIVVGISVRQTVLIVGIGFVNSLLLYAYILFVCAANLWRGAHIPHHGTAF